MTEYAHPEVLVSADWVEQHLNDPKIRIVESDEDIINYSNPGHIPGAVMIDWQTDLQDQLRRDYIDAAKFAELCSKAGISHDTTVVFYGDKSNWWACYAFWAFKLFGHADCRVLNGGRKLWIDQDRPTTKEIPQYPPAVYKVAGSQEPNIRAFRDDVMAHMQAGRPLIDVRSTKEYTGEKLHMEDYPQEGALRGGHIPGAKSVPWSRAVNEDGTFKTAHELRSIFEGECGLKPTDDVVAYCRIGERSSLTWFVLTYLLGYPKVRNYDGSWTEWGNLVRGPDREGGLTVTPALEAIVTDLRDADRQERIEMLIDLAKALPPLPDRLSHFKDEAHRVPECQSPVFLFAEVDADRVHLFADAPIEAPTVRGFVSLLVEGLDGAPVRDVLTVPDDLIERTGMPEILGMLRVRGLHGVLRRLKATVAMAVTNGRKDS